MGMASIFTFRPTKWEVEHARFIKASLIHQKLYDGDLPDNRMWDMLERRFNLNEARFTKFHPNIAKMIRDSRIPDIAPCIDFTPPVCYTPVVCNPEPQPPVSAVPEPSALGLFALAVPAIYLLKRYRSR